MRYRILGPLEVEGADETLLRRRKPRALLAMLLLHANRPVSTSALVEGLWGEDAPPSALGALQNYVSQLRKSLGRDVLVTRAPGYMLIVEPDDLDLERFERLVADAANADAAERAGLLREALALWRGPALVEFADEPFAEPEIRRLEALHVVTTEELLATELELGRHAELVPELERLVREDALSERRRSLLMLALYRSGRQADALAVYRDARKTLDELGLVPGEELQRLERAILVHDASLAAPVQEPRRQRTPPREPPSIREDRRTVTVLFADVTGSTSLGETLDPETLRALMSSFFREAQTVVERHGGMVEKFSGDEVMAVFGVPTAHEDDALRAVRAANEMLTAVEILDDSVAEERGIRFRVRIGVNTGEVVAGAGSPSGPFVTGAAVTTGKRLQEVAEPSTIVIGASTLRLVRDAVEAEPLGTREVRGKAQQIEAFRVTAVDPGAAGVARAFDTPIVGRERELSELRAAFESVRAESRCRLIALLGDAGIGKTRVARELVAELEPDARVLVGRCIAYGDGATYLPVVDAFRDVLSDLETLLPKEEDGATVYEHVSSLFDHGDGDDDEPPVPTAETAWAVRRAFEALARQRPLVVVFDDVHWGEPTFLDLLEYVTAWSQETPILVLALARPELMDARSTWAASDGPIETMAVRPLGDDETRTLVANVASSLDDEQRERIASVAEGFPLFAEQLVAYLEEAGGELDADDVPPTIEALLASRLERLEPDERDVLERAAVVGREFWRGAVAALTPEEERAAVGRHLISLVRKAFVQPVPSDLSREDALRFRHVLVRDVTYAAIPKTTRAELHERVAEWLERRSAEPDEIVGYHLEQAHRYRTELGPGDRNARRLGADAGERLGRAGVRALARGDSRAAVNLLTRASELLPRADALRLELLCELGVAHHLAGDVQTAAQSFRTALDEAVTARDRRIELRARVELATLRLGTDRESAAFELTTLSETAVSAFEALGDDRALGRMWYANAYLQGAFLCRNAEWESAAERALTHYRGAGWPTTSCVQTLAAALFYGPRRVDEAAIRCHELLEREVTDRAGEAGVIAWRSALEALRGEFDSARAGVAIARRTYNDLAQPINAAVVCDFVAALAEMLADEYATAETILRASAELLQERGLVAHLANRAAELADVLQAQDRFDEAAEWLELAKRHTAADDLSAQFTWRSVRAKIAARTGELIEAEGRAQEALELVDQTDALNQRADVRLSYAEVLLAAGRPADAASIATEACALYEQKGNLVGVRRANRIIERPAMV